MTVPEIYTLMEWGSDLGQTTRRVAEATSLITQHVPVVLVCPNDDDVLHATLEVTKVLAKIGTPHSFTQKSRILNGMGDDVFRGIPQTLQDTDSDRHGPRWHRLYDLR